MEAWRLTCAYTRQAASPWALVVLSMGIIESWCCASGPWMWTFFRERCCLKSRESSRRCERRYSGSLDRGEDDLALSRGLGVESGSTMRCELGAGWN